MGTWERPAGVGGRTEYVDETPARPRRSAAERAAEARLDFVYLSVLAYETPLPARLGDNRGALPLWTEVNKDWRDSGDKHWLGVWQSDARLVRLDVLAVRTREKALLLQGAVDAALGVACEQVTASRLRHRFRDAVDLGPFVCWWPAVLLAARDELVMSGRVGLDFEICGRADAEAAIRRAAERCGRHSGR